MSISNLTPPSGSPKVLTALTPVEAGTFEGSFMKDYWHLLKSHKHSSGKLWRRLSEENHWTQEEGAFRNKENGECSRTKEYSYSSELLIPLSKKATHLSKTALEALLSKHFYVPRLCPSAPLYVKISNLCPAQPSAKAKDCSGDTVHWDLPLLKR